MEITVQNDQKTLRLNLKNIKALGHAVLKLLKQPKDTFVSISFVSKAEIKKLNRQYFRKNRITDVIALEYKKNDSFYKDYLGDIIIAPEIAKSNAAIYGVKFSDELSLYVIHGILHLLGYDDTTPALKKRIEKKQKEIIAKL